MSRLSLVTSSAIALLGATTLSSQVAAQQTLRQQLIGTWTMTSLQDSVLLQSHRQLSLWWQRPIYLGGTRWW
jgi:hypothetical protein